MLEVYDILFSDLWERFSAIVKDVEDRVLTGRPITEVTYEYIKEVIYQNT